MSDTVSNKDLYDLIQTVITEIREIKTILKPPTPIVKEPKYHKGWMIVDGCMVPTKHRPDWRKEDFSLRLIGRLAGKEETVNIQFNHEKKLYFTKNQNMVFESQGHAVDYYLGLDPMWEFMLADDDAKLSDIKFDLYEAYK